jgi:hypothetical protein
MLAGAVFPAIDETDCLPVVVDRGALVVDQPRVEPDLLDGVEVEVGLELRGLLRPGDPERVCRGERLFQCRESAFELVPARREEDDDLRAGLRAELLGEGRLVSLL